MDLQKDDLTIVAMVIGWIGALVGLGRIHGQTMARLENMENKCKALPKMMTVATCDERRAFCGRQNETLFGHGNEEFARLREEIAEGQRIGDERHKEVMGILMEMMRNGKK